MSKLMCMALLGAFLTVVGCESMRKDKDKATTQPMKMSADAKKCADGKPCCDKK